MTCRCVGLGLLLAVLACHSIAQPRFSATVKGGFTLANITGQGRGQLGELLPGAALGAGLLVGISSHWGLAIDALLLQAGSQQRPASHYFTRITYLAIPITANLYLGKRKLKPYLLMGPSLNIALLAKDVAPGATYKRGVGTGAGMVQPADASAVVGAGMLVPLKHLKLLTELRYNYGLNRLTTDAGRHLLAQHNSLFMLLVGVTLPSPASH